MTSITPQCMSCRHMAPDSLKCTAFPDGIPQEILLNEWDHTKPIEGDHGIQYEPAPDADPVLLP